MTAFGIRFDLKVARWAALENEHDRLHPDRNACGGVGGCTMMYAAVGLEQEIIEALNEWRVGPDADGG
jgi:hypothetical protein